MTVLELFSKLDAQYLFTGSSKILTNPDTYFLNFEFHFIDSCKIISNGTQAFSDNVCFLCFLMYHRQELIRFSEKLVDFFNIYAVSSDGAVRYSDVRAFLDKDKTTIGLYISIKTVVNNTIALTPNHLVYVNKIFNDQFVLM